MTSPQWILPLSGYDHDNRLKIDSLEAFKDKIVEAKEALELNQGTTDNTAL